MDLFVTLSMCTVKRWRASSWLRPVTRLRVCMCVEYTRVRCVGYTRVCFMATIDPLCKANRTTVSKSCELPGTPLALNLTV